MDMPTVLLQARMGSIRLPGKAMADLGGKPLLTHAIEILVACRAVNRVVLCTTKLPKDDILVALAKENNIDCFRGSESDVLDRFYQASLLFPDELYFRATGDNPLLDPGGPMRILALLKTGQWDYVCEAGMPLGSVVEGLTRDCLHRSKKLAINADDLEHVTLFCKQSGLFRCVYPLAPKDCQGLDLRLTVDTAQDLERCRRLMAMGYGGPKGNFPALVAALQKMA